jgi:hypothetical protein
LPRTHHLEPTPARTPRHRLHQPPQSAPAPPVPTTTATTSCTQATTATATDHHDTPQEPIRRPHQRIPKRRLTSHDRISDPHRLAQFSHRARGGASAVASCPALRSVWA